MNDERDTETRPEKRSSDRTSRITPEMTILDIISQYRETEKIFKRLDAELGVCVCCQGLFLPLGEAARRYGFDLLSALADIRAIIDRRDTCRDA